MWPVPNIEGGRSEEILLSHVILQGHNSRSQSRYSELVIVRIPNTDGNSVGPIIAVLPIGEKAITFGINPMDHLREDMCE